jgi:hypothetical protein
MMTNKAIRRGAIARGKRVRAASQARREKRWSMPILRDLDHDRLVYSDGSPIDMSDPRIAQSPYGTIVVREMLHSIVRRDPALGRFLR